MAKGDLFEALRRLRELQEEGERKYRPYARQLNTDLVEHVYNWYPEWQVQRKDTEKLISEAAEDAVEEVVQLIYNISDQCRLGEPVRKNVTPHLKTREEAEKELQEWKKRFPEEDHEFLTQIHWEDFEWEQKGDGFLFEAHRLMKKALTDYYMDDLLELESDYLRSLDYDVYYLGAWEFVQKCYEIMETE